jgi:dihydrofolate reductase
MNDYAIIAAIADNNAIGRGGDLMWHIHEDMVFFRNTTRGHPVIMGRKTWDSLQKKPLPKRDNIVITKDENFVFEGVKVIHNIEEAKSLPKYDNEVFVIGGGTIYKEFIPIAKKLYITRVFNNYPDADTFFPKTDLSLWKKISESEVKTDKDSRLKFQFFEFERK